MGEEGKLAVATARAPRASRVAQAQEAERLPAYLTFLRAMERRLRHSDPAQYGHFLEELFTPINFLIEPARLDELRRWPARRLFRIRL